MAKKLLVAGLCALMVLVSSLAMAGDVVVTKHGKKYHAATCPLVANKQTSTIDEQQAIMKGLKPCAKCIKSGEEKK